jgi:uncharacterized protein (TIGR03067 family)
VANDSAASSAAALRGRWQAVSNGGKALGDVKIVWTIGADEIVVSIDSGEVASRSPYVVDATHDPPHIDMHIQGPPPEVRPGVYEIDGQNLRLDFNVDGGPRPELINDAKAMHFVRVSETIAN